MAKKRKKAIEMTSDEAVVEVDEEWVEVDEIDDDDTDAFEALDAEFDELDDEDEGEDEILSEADVDEDEDEDEILSVADVDEGEDEDEHEILSEAEVDEDEDEDDVYEDEIVSEVDVKDSEDDNVEDDTLVEDDGSGWLPDPDVKGQERFWDGTEWTDHVRLVDESKDFRGRQNLPDHVPELQRALAAATADIDDVESRLSTLFDRGQGKKRAGAADPASSRRSGVDGPPIHEEFGSASDVVSSVGGADPMNIGGEGAGEASGEDDEEATFAELDAALAAEAPEKSDRRFFKRRS